MAQTKATRVASGHSIPFTVTTEVVGDVKLFGTIPTVVEAIDPYLTIGQAATEGQFDVPKDTSTFTAGDAVYWNASGSPVSGTASSGAATSTPSAYLMGVVTVDAATGDAFVRVMLTAAKRTTTIAGSVTADDITGSDASLGIVGNAPATTSSAGGAVAGAGGIGGSVSGAGGAVSWIGGAGTTNAAGGTGTFSGGAGAGTGAGGAVTTKGGASGSGATGNGGAWAGGGGAALSTNGTGGAASLTGGVATGTGVGGAVTITSGASAGASGTAGSITIDAGSAASGTAGTISIGATNAGSVTLGAASIAIITPGPATSVAGASTAAAGSTTSDAGVLPAGTARVYPTTAADDTKGVRVHASDKVTGRTFFIGNGVSNKILKVYGPSGAAINGAAADAAYSGASGKGVWMHCLDSTGNTWLATG